VSADERQPARRPGAGPVEVLLLDPSFLAVLKPSGLPVLADRWEPGETVVSVLKRSEEGPLHVVHRLDRDASGVLLLARTEDALRALSAQFEQRTVEKVYDALVAAMPQEDEGRVDAPIGEDPSRPGRMRVDRKNGKPAVTRWIVRQRFLRFALLEVHPESGRTHQIRVHLAWAGMPLAVDPLYGPRQPILLSEIKAGYKPGRREERPLLERLPLHARQIGFAHPVSGERVVVEAPLMKDLAVCLKQLAKYDRPAFL